jgi:hypothetical protein
MRKSSSLSATGQSSGSAIWPPQSPAAARDPRRLVPEPADRPALRLQSAACEGAAVAHEGDPHHRGAAEREAGGDRRGDAATRLTESSARPTEAESGVSTWIVEVVERPPAARRDRSEGGIVSSGLLLDLLDRRRRLDDHEVGSGVSWPASSARRRARRAAHALVEQRGMAALFSTRRVKRPRKRLSGRGGR